MKKLILSLALAVALAGGTQFTASAAGDGADPSEVMIETILADGSTNTWTRADLVAALGLINRRYHRDVDTATGTVANRRAWHGRLVTEIVDTNALTRTQIYEDGMQFVDPWKAPDPKRDWDESNSKLPTSLTNGVPVALAEARARRWQEKRTTETVTVVTTVGGEE